MTLGITESASADERYNPVELAHAHKELAPYNMAYIWQHRITIAHVTISA